MNDTVEYYQKLILEKLYNGFMSNQPYRITNADVHRVFNNIENFTNFKIAREQLIQDDFLYGKKVDSGNPHFLKITGEGLVYYEKNHIFPCDARKYTILVSKLLAFLRDLGNKKYDIRKYILQSDSNIEKVEIPLSDIEEILRNDYNYELNSLNWSLLHFTGFLSKFIMDIQGVGIGHEKLSFFNPNSFCLNGNGYNFLKEVLLFEKFQKIGNNDGRNRVTQLYADLGFWLSKKRWVDVAINMGAIIEYCIDYYVEDKKLQEFFKKKGELFKFYKKLSIILENPQTRSDDIFKSEYRATWNRIQRVLRDWRNYIHISKLVKEGSPLDEISIKNFYADFESTINLLLNL